MTDFKTMTDLLTVGLLIIANLFVWTIVACVFLVIAILILAILYVILRNLVFIPDLIRVMWKYRKTNHPRIFGRNKSDY